MTKRLEQLDADRNHADPLKRLLRVQEGLDLQDEIAVADAKIDLGALEAEFVSAAKHYSERKGISYAAWRQFGVSAATLKKAGVKRAAAPREAI